MIKRHEVEVKQLEREFLKQLSALEHKFLESAKESKEDMLDQLRKAQKLAQPTDLDQAVRIRDMFRQKMDEDVAVPTPDKSGGDFDGASGRSLVSKLLLKQTKVKLSRQLASKSLEFSVPAESKNCDLLVSINDMADDEGDGGAYYSLSCDGDKSDFTFSALADSLFLFLGAAPGKSYTLTLQDSDTSFNGIGVTVWLVSPLSTSTK